MSTTSIKNNCPNCGAPDRVLWPPGKSPQLISCRNGNYIYLDICPNCNSLWCSAHYCPEFENIYRVKWDKKPSEWTNMHMIDDGNTLFKWHSSVIREKWKELATDETELIEKHRKLTSDNPIDMG